MPVLSQASGCPGRIVPSLLGNIERITNYGEQHRSKRGRCLSELLGGNDGQTGYNSNYLSPGRNRKDAATRQGLRELKIKAAHSWARSSIGNKPDLGNLLPDIFKFGKGDPSGP